MSDRNLNSAAQRTEVFPELFYSFRRTVEMDGSTEQGAAGVLGSFEARRLRPSADCHAWVVASATSGVASGPSVERSDVTSQVGFAAT